MSEPSRRHFLRNSSVAAAAVGAAAVVPMTAASAAEPTGPQHEGHFTVWVRDAKSGDVVVQAGEREITHHDPALARTLARIAAKA